MTWCPRLCDLNRGAHLGHVVGRAKEMKQPLSPVSISRYRKVLGDSWHAVCVALVARKSGLTVNQLQREMPRAAPEAVVSDRHRRTRTISLSLRYEVLKRDNFRCVKCEAHQPQRRAFSFMSITWCRGPKMAHPTRQISRRSAPSATWAKGRGGATGNIGNVHGRNRSGD